MTKAYETTRTLEPLLTISDVGSALNVSRATIYRLIEAGELRPIRVSRRSARFAAEDIRAYIDRQRLGPLG